MAFPVRFRPVAKREIVEAHDWFEEKREGLGDDFVRAVDQMVERIRQHPELYAVDYSGVRLAFVRRFSYLVVYMFDQNEIEVIAVVHAHRDPNVWQSRVNGDSAGEA
jgi:plasmid stabilization system protein ParE